MHDPSALPLYATLAIAALMYPLGLFWTTKCCAKCVRVGCFLDPRGFWQRHSFNTELGYPLLPQTSPSTYARCRKQCGGEQNYVEHADAPPPDTGCKEFLVNAVPNWGGVIGCKATSTATQLEVELSGFQSPNPPNAPVGDDLYDEVVDQHAAYVAALNVTAVFDLDCDGNGGCIALADAMQVTTVEYFVGQLPIPGGGAFGLMRKVLRRNVQPVLSARVSMRNGKGVDASSMTLDLAVLSDATYFRLARLNEAFEETDLYSEVQIAALPEPEQNNYDDTHFSSELPANEGPGGRFGCARGPIAPPRIAGQWPYPALEPNPFFNQWQWNSVLRISASSRVPEEVDVVSITSNFGSGAHFRILQPATTPGPIQQFEKISGGNGYAEIGRRQPAITVSDIDGVTLAAVLQESEDDVGRPIWKLDAVTATKDGPIPANSDSLPLAFEFEPKIRFGRDVTGTYLRPAATLNLQKVQPDVQATIVDAEGSGAQLSLEWQEHNDGWLISSVNVDQGGEGYSANAAATFTYGREVIAVWPPRYKVTVDDGHVTSVDVDLDAPPFFFNQGILYAYDVDGVTIDAAGSFWIEDKTKPALKADVNVGFTVSSVGKNAQLSANIDVGYNSKTFSEITSLTINAAGTGYRAWRRLPNLSAVSTDGCSLEPADCDGVVFNAAKYAGNGYAFAGNFDLGIYAYGYTPYLTRANVPPNVPPTFKATLQ